MLLLQNGDRATVAAELTKRVGGRERFWGLRVEVLKRLTERGGHGGPQARIPVQAPGERWRLVSVHRPVGERSLVGHALSDGHQEVEADE